jgi:adenylate cyclase
MANQLLPDKLRRRYKADTVQEMWQRIFSEEDSWHRHYRHLYGMLPSNPRCVSCFRPFSGIGGALVRTIQGIDRSAKNPRFCDACFVLASQWPGGAEIELTMLFADVRGSTPLAEQMNAAEFSRLMNRFYEAAINVLVPADAFIDKMVGDEVIALFIPGFAGHEHARRAVDAAQALLRVTGHGERGGPWVPVGVGVHTGTAWVGSIAGASGVAADWTALGDNVNVTARLASQAGPGEILASEAACTAARIETARLERRDLALKGKSEPVSVRVLGAG